MGRCVADENYELRTDDDPFRIRIANRIDLQLDRGAYRTRQADSRCGSSTAKGPHAQSLSFALRILACGDVYWASSVFLACNRSLMPGRLAAA